MKMVPLSVDVTGIIMEGGRRWDEWRRIRERIPDNTAVPTIVGAVPTEEMSEHDRYILPFLDGRRSIEEIAVQTHNTEFHVAKLAYELVRSGLARVQTAAAAPPASPATAGAEPDEVGSLLAQAADFTAAGNGFHAWKAIRAALEIDPQSKEAREALREAEQRLLAELESAGIIGTKVPSLAVSVGEVTKMNFSPNEGFVLSRINGSWDIKSILKISPIREIDALLIFRKLLDDGVIVLR